MNRIKKIAQKNYIWVVLFACLIGFMSIVEDVFDKEIMQSDIFWYNLVSKYLISDIGTPIAKIITEFGGAFVVLPLAIILFIFIKNKRIGTSIFLNLGFVTLLNQILKTLVERPRPTEFRIIDEAGYSFPSGHSMISMAFYGYLIYLIFKNIKNVKLRNFLSAFLAILIALIGTSRIYLGVHYTSDVVAGFLISVAYLIIYIKITDRCLLPGDKSMKKISVFESFSYAIEGIITAVKNERNIVIHLAIMAIVIIMGVIFGISKLEWIICIILFALVIGFEMFNTAIEYAVDLACPEINPIAKKAKDVAAGAVLVVSIGAAIIGIMIFLPKFSFLLI